MSGETDSVSLLDEATKERARTELNENVQERPGQIETLRNWVEKHPYLTARTDDQFLLRFLRVSKYSMLAAQKRLEKFCVVRSSTVDGEPKWFQRQVLDKEVLSCLKQEWLYRLPGLDDEGRIICIVKYGKLNPKKVDIDLMFKCVYMVFDTILMDERAQINGVVVMEDAEDITLSHLKPFTPDVIKRAQNVWQEGYPIRLKSVHYMNLPSFFKAFLEVAKAFLKDKYKSRSVYHNKAEVMKEMVPKRMRPMEFEGDAGSITELVDATIESIRKNTEELERLKVCRVNDGKRPREEPQGDGWGMVGSFRKMAVD